MCCGGQRQKITIESGRASQPALSNRATAPPRPPLQSRPRAAAAFEYHGNTALTVVSPLTARTYRFDRPGARLAVDPRDTPWLTFVPLLKRASD